MPPPSRRAANEIQHLVNDLRKIPKDLKKELRPAIRKAAKPVLTKARQNASWSSRIPGATRVATRLAGRQAGVRIETNRVRAPHARAYENRGRPGIFRHRVYGRDVWVTQRARPFMWPAVVSSADQVARKIDAAVVDVARRRGFR